LPLEPLEPLVENELVDGCLTVPMPTLPLIPLVDVESELVDGCLIDVPMPTLPLVENELVDG